MDEREFRAYLKQIGIPKNKIVEYSNKAQWILRSPPPDYVEANNAGLYWYNGAVKANTYGV